MRSAWDAIQSRNIADWEALGIEVKSLAEQGESLVTPAIVDQIDDFFGSIAARIEDRCFVYECDRMAFFTCDGPGCGQRVCLDCDHSTKLEDGRRLCVECLGEVA